MHVNRGIKMKQDYKEPEYYTFPLLANKLGIAQIRIEIDFKTGKINNFLIDNLNTKASPNTRKRVYKLLPILNQYARDHLVYGPSAILCQYGLKNVVIGKSRIKYLTENIDKDNIFELWLREYGIDIDNIKIVIPKDEAVRYQEYLNGITNEVSICNTALDVIEYVDQIREEKGCKHKSCKKCDNENCRNQLAYEIANKYGDHTPYRVRLCDIGIAMGCPEPTKAKNKEDEDQMGQYKKEKNAVKSQVRRWIAAHRK